MTKSGRMSAFSRIIAVLVVIVGIEFGIIYGIAACTIAPDPHTFLRWAVWSWVDILFAMGAIWVLCRKTQYDSREGRKS